MTVMGKAAVESFFFAFSLLCHLEKAVSLKLIESNLNGSLKTCEIRCEVSLIFEFYLCSATVI